MNQSKPRRSNASLIILHHVVISCPPADRAFMDMIGAVDKELATFSFKLARLLFPVSACSLCSLCASAQIE